MAVINIVIIFRDNKKYCNYSVDLIRVVSGFDLSDCLQLADFLLPAKSAFSSFPGGQIMQTELAGHVFRALKKINTLHKSSKKALNQYKKIFKQPEISLFG